jgi:hypothetical protein
MALLYLHPSVTLRQVLTTGVFVKQTFDGHSAALSLQFEYPATLFTARHEQHAEPPWWPPINNIAFAVNTGNQLK